MNHFSMEFTVKAESVTELVTVAYTHAVSLAGDGWEVLTVSQKYNAEQVEADEQTYHTDTRYEVRGTFTANYRRIAA